VRVAILSRLGVPALTSAWLLAREARPRGVTELDDFDAVFGALAHRSRRTILAVLYARDGAEEDLDDRTGQVVGGDIAEHSWVEVWRFRRTPGTDTSASDEQHEITFAEPDRWMVAHRGWTVTDMTRLPVS
jgi:hypothetical protein